MSNIWFAIPSCRPAIETAVCLARWKDRGYNTAVLRQGDPVEADLIIPTGQYLGWARSTNILARHIIEIDPGASWIVGGGDDYHPDLDHDPAVIARECTQHFGSTYGVMQSTGDRWGDSPHARTKYGEDRGAYIDRVAGSPWMGRRWCELAYLGNGPMWDGYHHLYADEELQEVATLQGRFWQRRDLTQFHDHAMREKLNTPLGDWPEHLKPINTPESWNEHKRMFEDRKRRGFPGNEPIPGCLL